MKKPKTITRFESERRALEKCSISYYFCGKDYKVNPHTKRRKLIFINKLAKNQIVPYQYGLKVKLYECPANKLLEPSIRQILKYWGYSEGITFEYINI